MSIIITFPIGYKPVLKHGDHDQSTHGAWATGGSENSSSESNLNSMPYEWKPKGGNYGEELSPEKYKETLDLYKEIAKAPIAIQLDSQELESIIADGRFKSLGEISSEDKYKEVYLEGRSEIENNLWGVPKTGTQPIYGYLDTKVDGHEPATLMYGDVKITLKDNVAERATFTAGDSLNNFLTPVLVKDAQEGKISNLDLVGSFRSYVEYPATEYRSYYRTIGPTENFQGGKRVSYFEAQIHGGISLKDIKSVDVTAQTGYTPPVSQKVIKSLRAKGIEVIETNG